MAWALALVVVIAVGLPLAAWLITHRLPPPRPWGRLGVGYDAIDKWLLKRYQLSPQDRWRVRRAVFSGRQISDPALASATHGLAIRVLSRGFRVLRLSQVLGWVELTLAIGFGGTGIVILVTNHHAKGVVLGVLGLINCGLFVLGPAATRRSSRVVTNRDDQTVAAPVSSTDTPKTTLYG